MSCDLYLHYMCKKKCSLSSNNSSCGIMRFQSDWRCGRTWHHSQFLKRRDRVTLKTVIILPFPRFFSDWSAAGPTAWWSSLRERSPHCPQVGAGTTRWDNSETTSGCSQLTGKTRHSCSRGTVQTWHDSAWICQGHRLHSTDIDLWSMAYCLLTPYLLLVCILGKHLIFFNIIRFLSGIIGVSVWLFVAKALLLLPKVCYMNCVVNLRLGWNCGTHDS